MQPPHPLISRFHKMKKFLTTKKSGLRTFLSRKHCFWTIWKKVLALFLPQWHQNVPNEKKNPSKTEPIFRKKSLRLSVKENLGSLKDDVIPCNFNQAGNLLKGAVQRCWRSDNFRIFFFTNEKVDKFLTYSVFRPDLIYFEDLRGQLKKLFSQNEGICVFLRFGHFSFINQFLKN